MATTRQALAICGAALGPNHDATNIRPGDWRLSFRHWFSQVGNVLLSKGHDFGARHLSCEQAFVPLRALGSRMRQAVESRLGMPAVIAGGLEFAQRRAFRRHVRPGSGQLEEEKQACEDKCRLLQARMVHTQLMRYDDTEVPASQPGCVSRACRIDLHHSSLWKSGRSPCDCKSPYSLGCARIPGRNWVGGAI